MSVRKFVPHVALSLLGALGLGLVGCGGGSSNPNTSSNVRVVNALVGVPGSGAIDLAERSPTAYIPNGQNVAYGAASKYGTVAADNVNAINIFASATGVPATTLAQGSYTQTNSFYYTEVVTGVVGAAAGSATAPQVLQFTDDIPAGTIQNTQNAAVRVINASPGLPTSIQVYNDTNGPVAITDLGTIAYGHTNPAAGNNIATGYLIVPAGTYTFSIRDNVGNIIAPATAGALTGLTLKAGTAYTIITVGSPGTAQPFDVKVIQDYPF
jgi:hypothetical protein